MTFKALLVPAINFSGKRLCGAGIDPVRWSLGGLVDQAVTGCILS